MSFDAECGHNPLLDVSIGDCVDSVFVRTLGLVRATD